MYKNENEVKFYFKKSYHTYLETMKILKLDGYVTEYCELIKAIADLYNIA